MKDLIKLITTHLSNYEYYNSRSNSNIENYIHKGRINLNYNDIKIRIRDYRIVNNIICFRYKISNNDYKIFSDVYVINDIIVPNFKIIKK